METNQFKTLTLDQVSINIPARTLFKSACAVTAGVLVTRQVFRIAYMLLDPKLPATVRQSWEEGAEKAKEDKAR